MLRNFRRWQKPQPRDTRLPLVGLQTRNVSDVVELALGKVNYLGGMFLVDVVRSVRLRLRRLGGFVADKVGGN